MCTTVTALSSCTCLNIESLRYIRYGRPNSQPNEFRPRSYVIHWQWGIGNYTLRGLLEVVDLLPAHGNRLVQVLDDLLEVLERAVEGVKVGAMRAG